MPKNYKILIWILIVLFLLGISFWAISRFVGEKKLQLISPNGKEEWRAGRAYQITWKSRKIGKVGIMLMKGDPSKESEWIAKDISARGGKYEWKIFAWQSPGQHYKIAIFEYPWLEGDKIDYSDDFFTIVGPQFASCDILSVETEWPFLPSDFPDLRKIFITKYSWSGNLEGLEGADRKCQAEAKDNGFNGSWKAFLGDDQIFATERLNLEGIFVEAKASATLPEEKTCHRLLGKNFEDFFKKLSGQSVVYPETLRKEFLNDLANIWLGRITKESKRDCLTILSPKPFFNLSEGYSFTTTCQNWTAEEEKVSGYPPKIGERGEFPKCYTPEGVRIDAVGLAGLASGLTEKRDEVKFIKFTPSLGKPCNSPQKLLCIEQ